MFGSNKKAQEPEEFAPFSRHRSAPKASPSPAPVPSKKEQQGADLGRSRAFSQQVSPPHSREAKEEGEKPDQEVQDSEESSESGYNEKHLISELKKASTKKITKSRKNGVRKLVPDDVYRGVVKSISLSPGEYSLMIKHATKAGMSLSAYIRHMFFDLLKKESRPHAERSVIFSNK